MGPGGDVFAVFRPVAVRVVAILAAGAVVVACGWVVLTARGPLSGPATRATLLVVALAAAWLGQRLGGVCAVPSRAGLVVRNVGRSRVLRWEQVVSVRFGPSDPWVRLDLADGSSVAVLAVQRSDGRRAVGEGARLAALVVAFGEADDR